MGFDVAWIWHRQASLLENRIEAFDMADLQDDVFLVGHQNQMVGLRRRVGQRLFDEGVNSVI